MIYGDPADGWEPAVFHYIAPVKQIYPAVLDRLAVFAR
jgi:hypothetical protein